MAGTSESVSEFDAKIWKRDINNRHSPNLLCKFITYTYA